MINRIRTWISCDGPELVAERAIRKQLETEHKRLTDQIEQLQSEIRENDYACRELRLSLENRIQYLESENGRLQGYETAVRELNRSVEILAEDVPF